MKWLIDEMLPPPIVHILTDLGHDAVWVDDASRRGATDRDLLAHAVSADRCVVTENVADFAVLFEERTSRGERCVPIGFIRKAEFGRRGGGLAARIAQRLHEWDEANPEPYVGLHWP